MPGPKIQIQDPLVADRLIALLDTVTEREADGFEQFMSMMQPNEIINSQERYAILKWFYNWKDGSAANIPLTELSKINHIFALAVFVRASWKVKE